MTLRSRRESFERNLTFLMLMMGAIPGAGVLAQSPAVNPATQTDAAATRPRRLTTDGLGDAAAADNDLDRQPDSHSERRIFVQSSALLVRAAVVEDKLLKRPEFKQLGFVITRDSHNADLVLELRHDLFTKYVFSVIDARTGQVLTSGKLSSVGGTVGGKVAKRFVEEMTRAPTH